MTGTWVNDALVEDQEGVRYREHSTKIWVQGAQGMEPHVGSTEGGARCRMIRKREIREGY